MPYLALVVPTRSRLPCGGPGIASSSTRLLDDQARKCSLDISIRRVSELVERAEDDSQMRVESQR